MSYKNILAKYATDQARVREQCRFRQRQPIERVEGKYIWLNGKKLVNFSGNDYLGLSQHPEIISVFKKALDEFGTGSTASNLVCGYRSPHKTLEEKIMEITRRSSALLFSSGYLANLAILTALSSRKDTIIADRLDHASIIDAAVLSRATLKRYQHASLEDFASVYHACKDSCKLVITEGVFSMDGDVAPLKGLARIVDHNKTLLAVDDAHGFGVLGKNGGGCIEYSGLTEKQIPLMMGTFGKAVGIGGAFIAGHATLIEQIIQKARTYIYTTAMPPAQAVATEKSLELMQGESWRREKLCRLINRFKENLLAAGINNTSKSPVQPVLIGSDQDALSAAEYLRANGQYIIAIRPPTVARGTSRLRISITVNHEPEDIDNLVELLSRYVKRPGR